MLITNKVVLASVRAKAEKLKEAACTYIYMHVQRRMIAQRISLPIMAREALKNV